MKLQLAGLIFIFILQGSTADKSDTSEFPIRRSSVLSTWQSSFGDGQTCFFNRSPTEEASVVSDKQKSYRFFHSKGKSQADGGFHWFAVQLNEPVLISSVTVKGREDEAKYTYNRVIDIEIWTSSWSRRVFSGDEHCTSRSMSGQFNDSLPKWTLCGVINSSLDSITRGELITVSCVNGTSEPAHHLLLRKDVSGKKPGTKNDDVTSCTSSPNSASNATFSATVSALVFVLTALICGFALLKLKLKSRQLQSSSPAAKLSNVPENPAGVAKAVRKTEPTLRPRVTARSCEPECSYLSVDPNAEPADNSDRNSDTASDCTVYLEIVADAN
uniref:Sushi domain-containing protein n=1 Tax=Macrostomum lignano TaxID=282301 RepID=A0A1I8H6B9_9PLAT